jgi:TPP-dependent pyruvate/acetoin dehydrogenase alpha subunit
MFRLRVIKEGKITAAEMDAIDAKITTDMAAAVEFGRTSPEPEVEMALQDIFTE